MTIVTLINRQKYINLWRCLLELWPFFDLENALNLGKIQLLTKPFRILLGNLEYLFTIMTHICRQEKVALSRILVWNHQIEISYVKCKLDSSLFKTSESTWKFNPFTHVEACLWKHFGKGETAHGLHFLFLPLYFHLDSIFAHLSTKCSRWAIVITHSPFVLRMSKSSSLKLLVWFLSYEFHRKVL